MEERRTARRYRLALPVSIKLKSGFHQVEESLAQRSIFRLIGFYLRTGRTLDVGAKFRFSITLPRQGEETVQGFVSGQAAVVRVERRMENTARPAGIAAVIETYKIVQSG